jgi:glycosyltransferase involved in cell wall biosynthesis
MADVLLLSRYERLGASSRIRSYQYLDALALAGIEVDVCPLFNDEYVRRRHSAAGVPLGNVLAAFARRVRDALTRRDAPVLWVEYEILPWLPYVFERALLPGGRPFAVDYDDAIFHKYDQHPSGVVRTLLGRKIDRLMRAASVVIAGNDYLAARARSAGAARVQVVPSVIDLSRYRQKAAASAGPGFRIGWIGSPSTTPYLRSLEPVLRSLGDIPGLEVVSIGGTPWQAEGIAVENLPWAEDTEVRDMLGFDVGVMPLPDDPWARGKCGFKLIQYMGCALPVVASPVGANAQIVEHGRTGFHATTPEQWAEALRALAADPSLRNRMGAAGFERVRTHYSLDAAAPRVVAIFRDLLAQARSSCAADRAASQ